MDSKINKIKSNTYIKSSQKRCPKCFSELNMIIDTDLINSMFKKDSKLNTYYRSACWGTSLTKLTSLSYCLFNVENDEDENGKSIIINNKRFSFLVRKGEINKKLSKKCWIGGAVKCNACDYYQYVTFEKV